MLTMCSTCHESAVVSDCFFVASADAPFVKRGSERYVFDKKKRGHSGASRRFWLPLVRLPAEFDC